ncbi:MAG TPA: metallophosphoesterase [Candidatus Moranbacteria bacterium]|nr:metallophosphoesterase [Candidatus Moranbacteria bacterium]
MDIKSIVKKASSKIILHPFLAAFFLASAAITVGSGWFFSGYNYKTIFHGLSLIGPQTITIGFVADIHAGSQDLRTQGLEDENILYPSRFEENFKPALEKMEDCDLIIALGDSLNKPSKKYAKKIKDLTKKYPMAWVKGNHEDDEIFKEFQPINHYYIDKGKWRFVILDNGNIDHSIDYAKEAYIPRGYMEPEQVEWLKEVLKTDRKIAVAMHVPIFDRFDFEKVYPELEYLKKMFEDSGNVKYVLAGHFHINEWHKNINGIEYYIIPSLSQKGKEGYSLTLTLPND